jgi:hypothetical protein
MGFVLTIVYLLSIHMGLPERFPQLAPFRPQLTIALLTGLASIPVLFKLKRPLPALQTSLLGVFVTMVLLSWVPRGYLGGVVTTAQDFLPDVAAFFFVALHVTSIKRMKILAVALIAGAVLTVVEGAVQYHSLAESDVAYEGAEEPPFVMLQRVGEDDEAKRVLMRLRGLGLLNDPNDYSQYLLILMPLMLLLWDPRHKTRSALLLGPAAVIAFYGIYLSRSRGALVGLMVFAGLMIQGSLRWMGALAALGLAGAIRLGVDFTGGRDISADAGSDRLELWGYGIEMIKGSPLWGVGYRGYPDDAGGYTAHNSFMLCAAEAGLPAYFVWIALLVVTVFQLRALAFDTRPRAPSAETQQWCRGVLMSVYLFLATAFFLSRTYSATLYMVLGLCAALTGMEARRREEDVFPKKTYWPLWSAGLGTAMMAAIFLIVRLSG